jgi:DNA invertase Pin-like site-specific DNA recombinase
MINNSIRRAIIYTRVSTDEQAEHGFSLAHQEESLKKYCEFHNIKIVKHFQEEGASGKDFNRPAFMQLLEFIQKNKKEVEALIFTRWDRLSRSNLETLKMELELRKLGIKLVSTEQAIDDSSPEHKLMLTIYNSIAEIERDKISIRTREGMRRAAKEGYFTGNPPIGYRRVRINNEKPSLEPDENAPIIRQLFEDYAKGIYTVEDIRKIYWKKGVKRCYQGMQDLLTNITYIGKIRLRAWKSEEEIIIMGLHEPIIPDELFKKVQRVLYGRKWKMNFKVEKNEAFPLRGHLKCAVCGRNLTASKNRSRTGNLYLYYHCQDRCPERFRVDQAHDTLKKYLQSLTIRPEVKKAYLAFMQQVFTGKEGTRENEVRIYQAKIQRTKDLLNAAEDKFLQDLIDAESYKRAKERYQKEIATLEQELNSLKESETGYMKYLRESLPLLENLDYHFEKASFDDRQKLLKILFPEKLIFDNGHFINPSKDGISLLVEDVKEFENQGSVNKAKTHDLKVVKKLGRVG